MPLKPLRHHHDARGAEHVASAPHRAVGIEPRMVHEDDGGGHAVRLEISDDAEGGQTGEREQKSEDFGHARGPSPSRHLKVTPGQSL